MNTNENENEPQGPVEHHQVTLIIPGPEKRENRTEKTFEEIMPPKFPDLRKHMNIHVREAQ